jgi:hypothetical protein
MSKLKDSIRRKLRLDAADENQAKLDAAMAKLHAIEQKTHELESRLHNATDRLKLALGKIENRQVQLAKVDGLRNNEFQVFSQWGEDGIIQYLLRVLPVKNKRFIEFGAEDYQESNTRFLMINDNWSGLVIDGDKVNTDKIRLGEMGWKYDLNVVEAFITRENINKLITDAGFNGDVGILSVDLDGNDYWVWDAIDCVNAEIVICEYNSRFGDERTVTIPYDPKFLRAKAHYSHLYAGASLAALCLLAKRKGYYFVGTSSGGNNAFFVRNDLKSPKLKPLTPKQGFTAGKFREARNKKGQLSYITAAEEQKILADLPVVDVSKPVKAAPKKAAKRGRRA